jgi:ActR/RegA family two-component response regulator
MTGLTARYLGFTTRFYQKGFSMPTVTTAVSEHLSQVAAIRAPDEFKALCDSITSLAPLAEVQERYVAYALAKHGGVVLYTAKTLKVNRRTLQRWAKKKTRSARGEGLERTRMVGS